MHGAAGRGREPPRASSGSADGEDARGEVEAGSCESDELKKRVQGECGEERGERAKFLCSGGGGSSAREGAGGC
jgi:hypothetical protein